MITLDDLEIDFDGAIAAMAEEAIKETEAVPEHRREAWFLEGSANHLAKMLKFNAPDFLIQRAEESLMRKLRDRARKRRTQAASRGV